MNWSFNPIIDPENDAQIKSEAEIEAEGSEQLSLVGGGEDGAELPPDEEPLEELE